MGMLQAVVSQAEHGFGISAGIVPSIVSVFGQKAVLDDIGLQKWGQDGLPFLTPSCLFTQGFQEERAIDNFSDIRHGVVLSINELISD